MIIKSFADWRRKHSLRIVHSGTQCRGAYEKLAWHYQFPSLQQIAIHINECGKVKSEVSNLRKFLGIEETFNTICARRGMSEAGLVSPATWRETLSRFSLLIRRRRVQTDSKDFPYFLFYNIYGESLFDRLMGVRSVFCTWVGSCPCCQSEWQMYG